MGRPGQGFHGKLLSRLLWPTGVVFLCTLWIVFSTILWSSDGMNEAAAATQHERLVAALEHQVSDWRGQLAASVTSIDATLAGRPGAGRERDLPDLLRPVLDGYRSVLVVGTHDLVAGWSDGRRIGRLDGMLQAIVDGLASGRPRIAAAPPDLVVADGTIHALVTLPLLRLSSDSMRARMLVTLREVSDLEVISLARTVGLNEFRLAKSVPDGFHAVPFLDPEGRPVRYAVWRADRPGDLMRSNVVPMMVVSFGIAAILFGVVAFYLNWVARDLVRSQERSRELVGRDTLSGLSNRLRFSEDLDHNLLATRRAGNGLAVLFIDLDRFKDVNDIYGHQAGDVLIQQVAKRLIALLAPPDGLARFGGDEFAIIQSGIRDAREAQVLADRILDSLGAPFQIGDAATVTVGASIGIALAPQNGHDRETLMRLADTALYQAKNEGRNRSCFFHAKMDETIRLRKVVEDDLRTAIETDGLALYYQPLFSADGLRIVALEALVRWIHPTRGLISPADFIPIAEQRGLIIPLSDWVLRRACLDGKRWPGLRIAVNVSAVQFRHRDFVKSVVEVLDSTGFEPSRLELELTEGVVVEDADAAEAAIMDLRALGVHLALDDFGTGYSSLIYLRRFAFDTIKIDRSFLESMEATGESAILVHSIVHLGRALGLTVTAEGVETVEQHRFLQALGCHQLQGYLFSRPVPSDEIDRLLVRHAGGGEGEVRTASAA